MERIIVPEELVKKLKRFPQRLLICDEKGQTVRVFERVVEPSDATNMMSDRQMLQTLHDICLTT